MITKNDCKELYNYLNNKEDLNETLRKILLKIELLNTIEEANEKLDKLIKEENNGNK